MDSSELLNNNNLFVHRVVFNNLSNNFNFAFEDIKNRCYSLCTSISFPKNTKSAKMASANDELSSINNHFAILHLFVKYKSSVNCF